VTGRAATRSAGGYTDIRACQVAIFLVSAGVLILELSITRLFSALMFYHFGFMAISLAMFGLGASGLVLFGLKERMRAASLMRNVAMCCGAGAAGVILALAVILRVPITLEYSGANLARLCLIYVMLLVPFFVVGLAISMILFHRSAEVSRLYAWDLTGAAIGALITVPLLNWLGAVDACLAASVLFGGGAAAAALDLQPRERWFAWLGLGATVLVLAGDAGFHLFPLRFLKGTAKGETVFEKWNALSYVTVRQIPGQSDVALIEIDADAGTYILRDPFKAIGQQGIKDALAPGWASSIPNEFVDSGSVLVIGPGGGMDVAFALAWGAKHVDAVELNPIIANDIMQGRFKEYSGALYGRADVGLVVAEGRSFLRRSQSRYELIQLTLVDTWAASSAGAFSLAENHLYTTEAFCDYMRHLTDNGVLAVTRWIFPKPRETLRLMTTAFAAARQLGIADPGRHIAIAAVRLPGTQLELATFIFKRSLLSVQDLDVIERRLSLASGRLVYSPYERTGNPFDAFAQSDDKERFVSSYEFAVEPTTDDHPFFFNIIRGAHLGRILKLEPESRKNNLGIINLVAVAIISLILVGLFFIGPLLMTGQGRALRGTRGGIRHLCYFIAIGLGFILIEIALMQKFVLYLGHPIYALAVILVCLLVSAGAGALFTNRPDTGSVRQRRRWLFAGILAVIVLQLLALPVIFQATLASPLHIRIAISLLALAPLGFLLGQPFPIGLKRLDEHSHSIIPWAWGLNGAASVLGSVAAICIAMAYGYNFVVVTAAACYCAAWICSDMKK
jgi:hypothetical protein